MKMTRNRAVVLIAAVWICSSLISFPAIVFWRAVRHGSMPKFKCTFTEHLGYLLFSSTISFYLPLLVMVFTYCRIYRAAAEQTRSLKLGTKQVLMTSGELQLTLRIHRGGTMRETHHHQTAQNTATSTPEEQDEEPLSALHNNGIRHRHLGKNFSLSRKLAKFAKEKKAAKTLGIVMGMSVYIVSFADTLNRYSWAKPWLKLSVTECQFYQNERSSPITYYIRNHSLFLFLSYNVISPMKPPTIYLIE